MTSRGRSEKTQLFLTLSPENVRENEAESTIDDLIGLIRYHNEQYYVYAQPMISDVQYDHLFSLLGQLEKKFPHFLRPDSPTQKLAISLQEWFVKANHGGYPMLSLQNTYNEEQIKDRWEFLIRQGEDDGNSFSFIVEPKFDGSSVQLIYKKWRFSQAISRWDGTVGEDITENVKTVRNLPLYIPALAKIPVMRFRAEIVMPKHAFEQLNKFQQEEDLPLFANARNAAAWTLRQLDPLIVAQRNLIVFVHELLTRKEANCASHVEMFKKLEERSMPFFWFKHYTSIDDVVKTCMNETVYKDLQESNIEFDWLVIKVNEYTQREQLGTTAHHPRRAIAYKYPALQVATKLNAITYQVGRTGVITPVANLDPVQLSGAMISKATLHNFDFIADNDIRVGDFVRVQRSGEVIPYVVGPIVARREGDEQPFMIPTICPSCWQPLSQEAEEVAWYCTNRLCDAQVKEWMKHFVAKWCMNIAWLGESIVELLVDSKLVQTYVDLYTLALPEKRIQMHSLPWIAEKKIDQILTQIETSKSNSIWRLLHWLWISYVGKKVATMLETYLIQHDVSNYEQLIMRLTNQEALKEVYWLWPQTISALYDFFTDPINTTLLKSAVELGVNILPVKQTTWTTSGDELAWQTIVLTWTLPHPREQIAALLEEAGAKVTTSVTSKTTRLLAWETAGSKYDKAIELQIPIYNWEEAVEKFPLLTTLGQIWHSTSTNNVPSNRPQSLFG